MTLNRHAAIAAAVFSCSLGCGTSTVPATIRVSPAALEFGSQTAGTSSAKTVTVTNPGTTPLLLSSVAIEGDARDAFSVGTSSQLLAAGSSLTLTITYAAPASPGSDTATLAISSNAAAAPVSPVSLSGESVAACVPETDAELCAGLGADCGALSGTDNCGATRSVSSCGTCVSPQLCAGLGVANVCATPVFPLSVTLAGTGSGTVISTPAGLDCGATCDASFGATTTVSLTATPDSNSAFSGFSGACTGSTCSLTITAAANVTANFVPLHTLTINAIGNGSGSISAVGDSAISCSAASGITSGACSGQFPEGTMLQLSAAPGANARFGGWSGACTGATCAVTMSGDLTATADFIATFPLSVALAGIGAGVVTSSPSGISCGSTCSAVFDVGSVSLSAAASAGSSFAGFSGACTGATCSLNPGSSAALSVTALFSSAPSQLAFTSQPANEPPGISLPIIMVAIEDAAGDPTPSTATVSLSATPGATISGTTSVAAVNGVATFTGLSMAATGTYSLIATSSPLTQATSNSFTIAAAAPQAPQAPATSYGASVFGALSGLRWELPNTGNNNSCQCNTVATQIQTTALGGSTGDQFNVTFLFRGEVEEKTYSGGTADGYWYVGGAPAGDGFNIYELDISSPPQTYFLNAGSSGQCLTFPIDLEETLTIDSGATVTLTANPVDGTEIPNISSAGGEVVVPGVPPYPQAYNGQFVQMDVLSVTPTNAGNGEVLVSWSAPADDGSPITSYTVTPYQGITALAPRTTSALSTSFSGLTVGTAYTFTVYATNAIGSSPPSAPSAPITPESVPGAPTAVVESSVANGTMTFTWTPPANDGGAPIESYLAVISPPVTGSSNLMVSGTSATFTGLTGGVDYTCTVAANSAVGTGPASSPSSPVAAVSGPAAPAVGAIAAGYCSETVNWTAPANNGDAITGYTVTAYNGDSAEASVSAGPAATAATVTGLTPGATYSFQVVASNAIGPGTAGISGAVVIPGNSHDCMTDLALRSFANHGGQSSTTRETVRDARADPGAEALQDRRGPLPGEGRNTGEHLQEHRAQAPDVAALVDQVRFATSLFRAHVRRSAQGNTGHAQRRIGHTLLCAERKLLFSSFLQAGEAPVDHPGLAIQPDDRVGRLHITVNDSALVGIGDGVAEIVEVPRQGDALARSLALRDRIAERDTLDESLRVIGRAVGELT